MPDDDTTTTTDDDDTTTTDDDDDTTTADDDEELEAIRTDPAGARKALEALKRESTNYRRELRKAELELERTKREGLSEQERAIAEARAEGRAEAMAEHGRRLLEAQVLAAAAGKLQDPGDAIRYLDLDALLELDDDERHLEKKLEKLVEEKPYLGVGANGGSGARRAGVQSQGARTAPGGTKASDADGSDWLRKAARRR